jgi:hypothetical protein
VNYATEVRAYSGALVQGAIGIAIGGDLFEAMPDQRSRPRRESVNLLDVSGSRIITVLSRHIEVFFGEFRRCPQ